MPSPQLLPAEDRWLEQRPSGHRRAKQQPFSYRQPEQRPSGHRSPSAFRHPDGSCQQPLRADSPIIPLASFRVAVCINKKAPSFLGALTSAPTVLDGTVAPRERGGPIWTFPPCTRSYLFPSRSSFLFLLLKMVEPGSIETPVRNSLTTASTCFSGCKPATGGWFPTAVHQQDLLPGRLSAPCRPLVPWYESYHLRPFGLDAELSSVPATTTTLPGS